MFFQKKATCLQQVSSLSPWWSQSFLTVSLSTRAQSDSSDRWLIIKTGLTKQRSPQRPCGCRGTPTSLAIYPHALLTTGQPNPGPCLSSHVLFLRPGVLVQIPFQASKECYHTLRHHPNHCCQPWMTRVLWEKKTSLALILSTLWGLFTPPTKR